MKADSIINALWGRRVRCGLDARRKAYSIIDIKHRDEDCDPIWAPEGLTPGMIAGFVFEDVANFDGSNLDRVSMGSLDDLYIDGHRCKLHIGSAISNKGGVFIFTVGSIRAIWAENMNEN